MNLVIFGDIDRWSDAVNILTKYRPDIHIIGLCSLDLGDYKNSSATVTLREALDLFHQGQIDGIININGENFHYFSLLENLGFFPVYVLPSYFSLQEELGKIASGERFIYPYKDILPELMQLEFHLADHCNLNCKGCTHFSNLVPSPVFANFIPFQNDIRRLASLFSHIHTFYLLGGEPLLNPDVKDYVNVIRDSFPYSQIILVTNGILLLSMKPELISFLRTNRVHLSISAYDCLDTEKIAAFIRQHGLLADLRVEKGCFSKFLNPKGDSNPLEIFEQCSRKNCTFLGQGRVAACCMPFVIQYFNQYFHESIPELESIDLYEPNLTGHELQKRLIAPMELCRFCSKDVDFPWEISSPPYKKEDWCV